MRNSVLLVSKAGLSLLLAAALTVPSLAAPVVASAAEPNDDINSAEPLRPSPFSDSLDEVTDSHDVFAVELNSGESFTATLTADSGSFDLHLFSDAATTVDGGGVDPVAEHVSGGFPAVLTYNVVTTGTYYLDIDAFSGSGGYTLEWEKGLATLLPDDDIPGSVELTVTPVTGTVDDETDLNDLYKIQLTAGDVLHVDIAYAEPNSFELFLFGPNTPSIEPPSAPVVAPSPAAIDHFVTQDGFYFLNVYALYGSGDYTITWSISRGNDADHDNDIPDARPLPSRPVTGTLGLSNMDDVFAVPLVKGQILHVDLGMDGGEFFAELFGPSAGTIAEVPLVPWAGLPNFHYEASEDATYFLDVSSDGDSGSYRVDWSIDKSPTKIVASQVPTQVAYDGGDVSVEATLSREVDGLGLAGRTLTLEKQHEGSGWTQVDSKVTTASGKVTFTAYRVTEPTEFRVMFAGDDDYAPAPNSSAGITAPLTEVGTALAPSPVASTVAWGGSATVSARLTRRIDSGGIADKPVLLEKREAGKGWVVVTTKNTAYDGRVSFSVPVKMQTEFRVSFLGVDQFTASSASAGTCTPKAYLTTPRTSASTYRYGTRITTTGYLKPRHTTGAKSVKIYAYRYQRVGGKYTWVLRRSYYATNSYYNSATSKYTAKFSLPYRGRWRLVARVTGDTLHAATASGARYLTVK